jgi:hypothetical protein
MRRRAALAASVLLVFALAGCGGASRPAGGDEPQADAAITLPETGAGFD